MKMNVLLLIGLVVFLGTWVSAGEVLYSQDFSTDPGWTTNDPDKLYWDSATETFYGNQVNVEGTYAYKQVSELDFSKAWRLSFDHKINSNQWSAGLTIGLFDSQISRLNANLFEIGAADAGQIISLHSGTNDAWTNNPAWSTGTWYHSVMEFDPTTQQLMGTISNRDTGEHFLSLQTDYNQLSGDAYVGVSRLHMQGGIPGASNSATVDYNLDNVVLEQVPEPATLALLGIGSILLRKKRA